jgi:hypothetical protein
LSHSGSPISAIYTRVQDTRFRTGGIPPASNTVFELEQQQVASSTSWRSYKTKQVSKLADMCLTQFSFPSGPELPFFGNVQCMLSDITEKHEPSLPVQYSCTV